MPHNNGDDNTLSMDGDPRVVAALKRYMVLMEQGSAPLPSVYCREYVEIADALAPCLEGLAILQKGFGVLPCIESQHNLHESAIAQNQIASATSALGDFRILNELGRGGMGIVYEAQQISLGRRVALKVLSFAGGFDAIRLQRFRNEAQAAAQLHHTHIVPVYAVGSHRGVHYYAMQLIEGRSLAQWIESAKNPKRDNLTNQELTSSSDTPQQEATMDAMDLDSTQAMTSRSGRERHYKCLARMMLQAAQGLEHAHLYGVIHRDIKPANILQDNVGNIWITDFGLAQIQSDLELTRTGEMLGTLRYMSPEQSSGGSTPIDHRTDIYSLGATFYELLTLRSAITGTGYKEVVSQIADQDPVAPRSIDSNIPPELETIVQKAIAKIPTDRYATAGKMADDLQRWIDDKPILAHPPSLLKRFAKWRRRHSSLVSLAIVFAMLGGIGLLITMIAVVREQRKTAAALAQERVHRTAAEVSFQQAKRAVDTFSEVSETEFANRPDLKSLRREFLEVSLEFYRDFIELKADDAFSTTELSATKLRVEKLIDALKRLDQMEPFSLLAYDSVQAELGIPKEQAQNIQELLERIEERSQETPTDELGADSSELVRQFNLMSNQLDISQWNRLLEIHRQARLPFTFKSTEVSAALGLTAGQRKNIGLIIEQERPDLAAKKLGLDRGRFSGPPRGPMDGRGPIDGRDRGRGKDGPRDGGKGRPPQHQGGPLHDEENRNLFEKQTAKTILRILETLTPSQLAKWRELVGKPFEVDFR